MKRTVLALILCCAYSACTSSESSCGSCLILTQHIENGNASLAKQLSEVNSAPYFGLTSYSAFMTVLKEYNNNLFYWFFPAATPLDTTPWIIWLSGGPGVSSMSGLFDAIGPLKVEDGIVKQRNVSWAKDYSVLFLDNPVGAGYSFTDDERGYTNNEDDVGAQMLEFLHQFLEMFPELRSAPLFIVGQSYAGKYVPALGIQIHRHNQRNQKDSINLRGIAVGNGLFELRNVMHYSELCSNLGLLDDSQITHVKKLEAETVQSIDEHRLVDAANKFNETIEYIKKHSGISVYNFLKDPSIGAPQFESYITSDRVRELIHVGNATFDYNNQHVYYKMLPDFANSTRPFVEELLEYYGVMSYTGQLDVILPYSLVKHLYATLNWSQRSEYVRAPRRRLRRHHNRTVVGYKKAGGNFVEILIRGAGHSVPVDQPEVAKYIIDSFIHEFK